MKQLTDLDFIGTSKAINLAAPTANGDAANKLYVDTSISGTGAPVYVAQYILPNASSINTSSIVMSDMTNFSLTSHSTLTLNYIILLNLRISANNNNRQALFNLVVGGSTVDAKRADMAVSANIYGYDFVFYRSIAPATNVKMQWAISNAGSKVTLTSATSQLCGLTILGFK